MILRVKDDGPRGTVVWLWCPGCDDLHCIHTGGTGGPQWTWDGDIERPTIQPSILVRYGTLVPHPNNLCHSFVVAGQWQFLGDSTHALAGQTVPAVPIPPGWFEDER